RQGLRSRGVELARAGALLAPAAIDGQAHGHARKPGPQGGGRCRRTLERAQEGLLHQVLGRGLAAHELPREALQESALVLEVGGLESGGVGHGSRRRSETAPSILGTPREPRALQVGDSFADPARADRLPRTALVYCRGGGPRAFTARLPRDARAA